MRRTVHDAEVVSVVAPQRVNPGDEFTIIVTMKNTGAKTWEIGKVFLGKSQPRMKAGITTQWGTPTRIDLPYPVLSGEEVTFVVGCFAPINSSQSLCWEMVEDKTAWFGDEIIIEVVVNDPQLTMIRLLKQLVDGLTVSKE